jgi:hypothetical protein
LQRIEQKETTDINYFVNFAYEYRDYVLRKNYNQNFIAKGKIYNGGCRFDKIPTAAPIKYKSQPNN